MTAPERFVSPAQVFCLLVLGPLIAMLIIVLVADEASSSATEQAVQAMYRATDGSDPDDCLQAISDELERLLAALLTYHPGENSGVCPLDPASNPQVGPGGG